MQVQMVVCIGCSLVTVPCRHSILRATYHDLSQVSSLHTFSYLLSFTSRTTLRHLLSMTAYMARIML